MNFPNPNANLIDFRGAPPQQGTRPAAPLQAPRQAPVNVNVPPAQPPLQLPNDPMTALLHSIYQMGLKASALCENQCLQGLTFETMTDQIHSLKTALQTSSNVKVQDLPLFKGKASEVESSMHDVNSTIYLQPVLLNGMDQAKCIYMAS